ncbi:MAG: hypothetical protein ACO1Q7_19590 [Gemmatimonas sp.]
MRRRTFALCTLTAAGVLACGGEGAGVSRDAGQIVAALDTTNGGKSARVLVLGLSSTELVAASKIAGDSAWHDVFRIMVDGAVDAAVMGRYAVNDTALVFTPQFPLDPGRPYNVRVNARALSPERGDTVALLTIGMPAANVAPTTHVVRVLPSGDVLPDNLLRLYVEFSAPMSRTGGLEHMKLVDSNGAEIPAAFLPLEADFWNAERTRYTAFLDPGRVKRGILPNEQLGRALVPGRSYAIVIDSTWRDERGVALTRAFRREFRVRGPEERRIDYAGWKLNAPRPDTRDTLVVTLDRGLDHGLLKRALGVRTKSGAQVLGQSDVTRGETEWRFVPDAPWQSGEHVLVILAILEDAAGNRIDGAFEVDMFNQIDKVGKGEEYLRTFSVTR